MTLAQFLEAFPPALRQIKADLFTDTPYIYPRGPYLRVKVVGAWHLTVPPILDPIGVVWYAQTGEFPAVGQAREVGKRLGLSLVDIDTIVRASDVTLMDLPTYPARVRMLLILSLETYGLSLPG